MTTTEYSSRKHPVFIGITTVVGAIGGIAFGIVAAIWSYDYEGLSYSEKRTLKIGAIDNLAATFNCNVTKAASGRRSKNEDDDQLPSNLYDVRFKCENMTLSERVLQMAIDTFKQIERENDDSFPLFKAMGKGFIYGIGGGLMGAFAGYYAANILVNIKLEFFGEGIKPADVRNKRQAKYIKRITKKFKLNDKEQALALLKHPELHIWFLQGIQKIKDGTIPFDIFIHIASYIGEFSDKNTYCLFLNYREVMPLRLFALSHKQDAKKLLDNRADHDLAFFSSSRSDKEEQLKLKLDNFENKNQETRERFKKRMSLYNDENSDTTTKQSQTKNTQSTKTRRRGRK